MKAPRACHLVGIAGAGMSALAQALLDAGAAVSGSDRHRDRGRPLDVLRTLERAGARLLPQDGSGVRPGLDAVVVSTAVEPGNADLEAASRAGVPVRHRAGLLAELASAKGRCTAVAGTAGKTTVTAMLGWVAAAAGLDPSVVNGGEVIGWGHADRVGSVRRGAGDRWIVETDESDKSLLRFHPADAILTGIGRDHFELDEVVAVFARFAGQVRGLLVTTPEAIRQLGAAAPPGARPIDGPDGPVEATARGVRFRYRGTAFSLALPGAHQAENAMLVADLAASWGVPAADTASALRGFRGVRRRMECVGEQDGLRVVDDYAHNPLKVAAALAAACPGRGRLLAAWRPHGFGPLRLMFDELVDAFARGLRPDDRLWLLPVYYDGGTAGGGRTSEELAAALRGAGAPAAAVADYAELERAVAAAARPGDVLLVMGARDPDLPLFARRMAGPRPDGGPRPVPSVPR